MSCSVVSTHVPYARCQDALRTTCTHLRTYDTYVPMGMMAHMMCFRGTVPREKEELFRNKCGEPLCVCTLCSFAVTYDANYVPSPMSSCRSKTRGFKCAPPNPLSPFSFEHLCSAIKILCWNETLLCCGQACRASEEKNVIPPISPLPILWLITLFFFFCEIEA